MPLVPYGVGAAVLDRRLASIEVKGPRELGGGFHPSWGRGWRWGGGQLVGCVCVRQGIWLDGPCPGQGQRGPLRDLQ